MADGEGRRTDGAPKGYTLHDPEDEKEHRFQARMSAVLNARAEILIDAAGRTRIRGQIPCKECGDGVLHYSIAGYNGHIAACCSTPKCLVWRE